MTTSYLAQLEEGMLHHCILQIFRSQEAIMVKVEKSGKPIAFGEGSNLSIALQRANVAYLKLFDKYAAQIARYDLTITNSNKSGNLTTFIKNGGRLYIERKGFFSTLIATASDWEGNIVCEISAPNLASLLSNLVYSLN